jgi:hypothetical protein
MTLPAYLLDPIFLEANLVIPFHEKLAREMQSSLEKLTKNPELQVPEHDRVYAQLMAQLSAVKAFVASMEEPWQKEKLRKQAKLL